MRGFWTKWGLCLLMFLATILNYLNRQTLSILAPTLQHQMQMGNEALGWLFAAFYYSYTLFQFAVGPVLDRFNLRWCFALAVSAWSLVSGMTALATGFAGLLVFRLLLGVMESVNWPASLRIVARVFPPEERTLASGIFTSGTSVAALIAPGLILAILAMSWWRWAFVTVGALGFLWVPLWLFYTRRPELSAVWSSNLEEGQESHKQGSVYGQLVRSGQFWCVLVVAVLVNPCLYYSVNWLPTYFAQVRGLAPGRQLGWVLTLTYLALDLGNIACGAMALWLTHLGRSIESARRTVFLSATVFVGACALVPFVGTSSAVLALLMVNFGLGIWVSMYLTMAQEVSHTHISTTAGTLSGFGSLVGDVGSGQDNPTHGKFHDPDGERGGRDRGVSDRRMGCQSRALRVRAERKRVTRRRRSRQVLALRKLWTRLRNSRKEKESMPDLRFAVFGAGFWAPFQIAAWQEVKGAKCVAIYNRTVSKARKVAQAFGIPAVYEDPEELLEKETLDFLDVITDGSTHRKFVQMAAKRKLPVISQKPMANTLADAEEMVRVCREAGVPLYVHENWRWQAQIRSLKKILVSGEIGVPFRAHIFLVSGHPVFDTEPNLRGLEEYILKDMGTHLLDVARFLFGEADRLYCQTHQVQQDIKGEDVATVMMHMGGRTTVTCCMGFPGHFLENDVFTQTLILVEGDKGSAELDRNYWVRITTQSGTRANQYPPVWRPWMHYNYVTSHSSIAPCNANLLRALRGEGEAETTGKDNLKTMRLTFAAYESARSANVIRLCDSDDSGAVS